MEYQNTIKREVTVKGIGLHSGKKTILSLKPAPANTGIVFSDGRTSLKCSIENVSGGNFAITIKGNGIEISTVEHLLAALYCFNIDNILCVTGSKEIPVLDGSSAGYAAALKKAGSQKLNAERKVLNLDRKIAVYDRDRRVVAEPAKGLTINYLVSYEHPLIGMQFKKIKLTKNSFIKEIARARTFGWQEQAEKQKKLGLIRGASVKNAVLFGEKKIINKEGLRYKDEVVRHKILDITGALALLPFKLNANILAVKSGHALDIKLIRKINYHRLKFRLKDWRTGYV